VDYARERGKTLRELTLEEYRRFSPHFAEDVLGLDLRASLSARDVPGGTAPKRVVAALKRARKSLEAS